MKYGICILALCASAAQAQIAGAGSVAASDSEAGALAGANSSNSLTINNPASPSEFTYKQQGTTTQKFAPAITITGPASGPCTGLSGGFGVSFLGGAVGGNLATVDQGCQLRESSRIMAMILPTLPASDQEEVRAMLMEQLRLLYASSTTQEKAK